MKVTIFVICLLATASAFGQANVLSNIPAPVVMNDHPEHASIHSMAQESTLLQTSAYSWAKGEQPLWEFGSGPRYELPLGDVARAYRKNHVLDKKATKVSENY